MTHEILLVEDSTAQSAVYRSYLEADGHHVHAVGSGEAALDYLQRRQPAAMLLDLQLPGIQGLEVMSRVKEQGRAIPVVVISDHGSTDNVIEAMRLGAVDFVTVFPAAESRPTYWTVRSPDRHSIELLQKGAPLPPKEPWTSMPNTGRW